MVLLASISLCYHTNRVLLVITRFNKVNKPAKHILHCILHISPLVVFLPFQCPYQSTKAIFIQSGDLSVLLGTAAPAQKLLRPLKCTAP